MNNKEYKHIVEMLEFYNKIINLEEGGMSEILSYDNFSTMFKEINNSTDKKSEMLKVVLCCMQALQHKPESIPFYSQLKKVILLKIKQGKYTDTEIMGFNHIRMTLERIYKYLEAKEELEHCKWMIDAMVNNEED